MFKKKNPQSKQAGYIRLAYEKGYRAQEDGSVISSVGNKLSLIKHKTSGYRYFSIKIPEGKSKKVDCHRFVAFQKFGEASLQEDVDVRHLDNDKDNNSFDNIVLGNRSENMLDRGKEDCLRRAKIAAKVQRRLSDEQVEECRELHKQGWTGKVLAEKYGVARSTISYIVNNKTYKED